MEVLSDPEPTTGTYRRARTCGKAETLTSEGLPQLAFPVAALFG